MGTQLLERDAAGSELVAQRRLDVAAEELFAEPEAHRQREDDLQVRAASPRGALSGVRSWTRDCAAWLDSNPIRSASDSNGLVTGRTMSASSPVGLMNRSVWTKKSSAANASRPRALSPCAMTRFEPKLTRARARPASAASYKS